MTRTDALRHVCPNCGAEPGEKCAGVRWQRQSVHRERWDLGAARKQETEWLLAHPVPGGLFDLARKAVAMNEEEN